MADLRPSSSNENSNALGNIFLSKTSIVSTHSSIVPTPVFREIENDKQVVDWPRRYLCISATSSVEWTTTIVFKHIWHSVCDI